jgi:preprotein translocase subunit SecD
MSFTTALRFYIILLFLAVLAIIVILPSTLRFDFGKKNVCRYFPGSTCTSVYRVPDTIPLVIPRPSLSLKQLGVNFERSLEYVYGLDIRGGSEVTLVADMSNISPPDRSRALESAREVIARRINLYGLSESTVTTAVGKNSYRLIATIPGITESSQITALIGSTAQLDFREYLPSTATPSAIASSSAKTDLAKDASTSGVVASPSAIPDPSKMLVKDFVATELSGRDLTRATAVVDQTTGQPAITLEFSPDGKKKLTDITTRNLGKPLAIFLDEYPISAPRVDSVISDGKAQISGKFSIDDAKSLASTLNAGSLPAPISILSQHTVEPSLGSASIRRSVQAGMIGLALVMFFLIGLYGLKGVISVVSLLYYALITLAFYKLIPVTLSLAGVAGFLLSIGMAVDTIVLVFERLREEETAGAHSLSTLLSRSFGRAWGSIKDANIVTLISAFLLANPFGWTFLNTSGTVRGFAFTLALGIVLNLFTGMFVLRVLLTLFYRRKES